VAQVMALNGLMTHNWAQPNSGYVTSHRDLGLCLIHSDPPLSNEAIEFAILGRRRRREKIIYRETTRQ
jgi:hypothetical protein